MLLLLTDSLLLTFITLNLGVLSALLLEKITGSRLTTAVPGLFLLGLLACSVYFNILSFWLPVNYLSLIPLLLLSIGTVFLWPGRIKQLLQAMLNSLKYAVAPPNLFYTLCVGTALLFYWILPPGNEDSAGYHYLSIFWYETYKVVPGLGNIDTRLAYDPASFIIQSAYSFTTPAGQSIYPLNGVLIGLFDGWLLLRLLKNKTSLTGLFYGVLIILLYRPLLVNISSPSPDALTDVSICYTLITLYETTLSKKTGLSQLLIPTLIILCLPVSKLYSLPFLLAVPWMYFLLPRDQRTIRLLFKVLGVGLLIYLPWIARNYILSGYPFFPLRFSFFHPDWQIARSHLNHSFHVALNPLDRGGQEFLWPLPLTTHFYSDFWNSANDRLNGLLVTAALFSPFCWFIFYRRAKNIGIKLWMVWIIPYASFWIWMCATSTYRFGAAFLSLSIILPFLILFPDSPYPVSPVYVRLAGFLLAFSTIHYVIDGCRKPRTYPFTIADCWLYPLKDKRYRSKNHKADFPYRMLRTGVKLYIEDSAHDCMNANLPCMLYSPGDIEMRGERIDQGFKNVREELLPEYP